MQSKLLHQEGGQKTHVLIFETGDEVMSTLQEFAKDNKLSGSHFSAIGAFQEVVLAYFDWESREYQKMPFAEQMEVVSLLGDIALTDKKEPKVHAHVVLGRRDGSARAGHLVEARVRPTLELVLVEAPKHLQRRHDERSGLALIQL